MRDSRTFNLHTYIYRVDMQSVACCDLFSINYKDIYMFDCEGLNQCGDIFSLVNALIERTFLAK